MLVVDMLCVAEVDGVTLKSDSCCHNCWTAANACCAADKLPDCNACPS